MGLFELVKPKVVDAENQIRKSRAEARARVWSMERNEKAIAVVDPFCRKLAEAMGIKLRVEHQENGAKTYLFYQIINYSESEPFRIRVLYGGVTLIAGSHHKGMYDSGTDYDYWDLQKSISLKMIQDEPIELVELLLDARRRINFISGTANYGGGGCGCGSGCGCS